MLVLHRRLELMARLLAASLCGVLLSVGYFLGRDYRGALLALPVGVALWLVTLRATKGLSVPWPAQASLMVAGFVTAWVVMLAVALSKLKMD